MTWFKYLIFSLILSVCILAPCQSFQVDTYNESNGLVSGQVQAMAQDREGKIWFTCKLGTITYDGNEWTTPTGSQKPPVKFLQMLTDRNGTIWATSNAAESPVYFLSPEGWQALPAPPKHSVNSLGLSHFAIVYANNIAIPVLAPRRGALLYFREGSWTRLGKEQGLGSSSVLKMASSGDTLYFAGKQGLGRLSETGLDFKLNELIPKELGYPIDLCMEEHGAIKRIWMMGRSWLGYLEQGVFHRLGDYPTLSRISSQEATSMLADGSGGVFLGYSLRLYHASIDQPVARPFDSRSGLGGDGVNAILRDREKNIWVSGLHGVSKIVSMRFANYDRRHGLVRDEVTAVTQLKSGEMLLAQESGFVVFDGHIAKPLALDLQGEYFNRPFYLHHASDGSIWAPTFNLGILRIAPDLSVLNMVSPVDPLGLEICDVLVEDNMPKLVGTTKGLRELKDGYLYPFDAPEIVGKTQVRRVIATKNGDIVVATTGAGVWIRHDGEWRSYMSEDVGANNATSLFESSTGRLLVGTEAGIYSIEHESLLPWPNAEDKQRNVYFISEDLKGRLWVGVGNGVCMLDHGKIRHFTLQDGLNGVETNRGGGYVDNQGRVWIATDRGISRFQDAYDFPVETPTTLRINGLESGGIFYRSTERVDLPPDRNDLTLHFQVISHLNQKGLTFQSWLEGYDKGWLNEYKSESRSYRYTSLPQGSYRFHVRVRCDNGDWSSVVSSGSIHITPPFWRRMWFVVCIFLLLAGISYSLFDYFSSKRYSRYLEKQIEERTMALSSRTEQLQEQIRASRKAEAEVQALNEDLEARVVERTTALETAQRDLVENAHYAGMAEIANSIIHNVGNILNSVSTSGYLIRQTIEDSKMTALMRANDLLLEHMDDLEHFILRDPRGKQLLMFYISLGEVFQKERERLTRHATLLMEKIDSIKDVVAQQHNYASGVYQNEELDPRALVDSSLKIMESGLENHGITLIRRYNNSSALAIVQRTKFIHIIVNLLKNAKESILSQGGDERRITVAIFEEDSYVVIRIEDTGLGIPKEHLQRIFNHGFTTKKGGHGFGLHSSANAIQEMSGSMWAESDGVGRGARFVLRLSMAQRPAAVLREG